MKWIHWYTFLEIVHMGFVGGLSPLLVVLDLLEVVLVVVGQLQLRMLMGGVCWLPRR